MKKQIRAEDQSGQVGLVVLLIGAVLLTLGIGAVSQSIIETKLARQEMESSQAFNAAEQGIEQILNQTLSEVAPSGNLDGLPSGYTGTYAVTQERTYTSTILEGHSADIDMTDATSLSLTWTTGSGCGEGFPAIIVTLFDGSGGLVRNAYRHNTCAGGDNFDTSAICVGGPPSTCAKTINGLSGIVKARVKAVYDNTEITATGGNFPVQGYQITTEATNTNSGETRSVMAIRTNPAVPGIFDYAVLSGTSLSQ